ncbi:hypothetical protein J2T17_007470 [Paenibacillus mucilaginosus]
MAQNQSSNRLVVPQASRALDQLKYEVAQELRIQIPQDGYYGYMTTRDTGAIGGHITRRLVQIVEQQLSATAGGGLTRSFSGGTEVPNGFRAAGGQAVGNGFFNGREHGNGLVSNHLT